MQNTLSRVHPPLGDLKDKIAFISGGSSGIGLGIAQACVDAGMKVAIGYLSDAHIGQAMRQLASTRHRVHPIRVDVTDRPGMANAAAEVVRAFGKVHVLVNNAGVQNRASLANTSYEEWDALIGVNVDGVFNGLHTFLPRIKEHGEGGHVITTSSILGLFTAGANYGAYCASKFAATAMMEVLRAELAAANIGVSVLCPGPVKSNLEAYLRDFELAADPVEVGRLVVRGMKNNDLYILTHPEFNPFIQCRSEAIIASTPKDVRPSVERKALADSALKTCIYVTERGRHLDD